MEIAVPVPSQEFLICFLFHTTHHFISDSKTNTHTHTHTLTGRSLCYFSSFSAFLMIGFFRWLLLSWTRRWTSSPKRQAMRFNRKNVDVGSTRKAWKTKQPLIQDYPFFGERRLVVVAVVVVVVMVLLILLWRVWILFLWSWFRRAAAATLALGSPCPSDLFSISGRAMA